MASVHILPPLLYSVSIVLPVACTLIVAARVTTRKMQKAKLGIDDWLTVPALALIIIMGVGVFIGTAHKGLGYTSPPFAPGDNALTAVTPNQKIARFIFVVTTILQSVSLAFIKLSCMFFYLRIFAKGSSRAFSVFVHSFNGLIIIWGLALPLSFLFGCRMHFSYLWTTVTNQLRCEAKLTKIVLGLAVSDMVMDVIILLLPIPLIMRLKLSRARKLAVMAIFALGSLSIAASIMRMVIVIAELGAEFEATTDQGFVATALVYFMFIECGFALIAICLPTLYGSLKLKGIRTLIESFTDMFANMSCSFLRSNKTYRSQTSRV